MVSQHKLFIFNLSKVLPSIVFSLSWLTNNPLVLSI